MSLTVQYLASSVWYRPETISPDDWVLLTLSTRILSLQWSKWSYSQVYGINGSWHPISDAFMLLVVWSNKISSKELEQSVGKLDIVCRTLYNKSFILFYFLFVNNHLESHQDVINGTYLAWHYQWPVCWWPAGTLRLCRWQHQRRSSRVMTSLIKCHAWMTYSVATKSWNSVLRNMMSQMSGMGTAQLVYFFESPIGDAPKPRWRHRGTPVLPNCCTFLPDFAVYRPCV